MFPGLAGGGAANLLHRRIHSGSDSVLRREDGDRGCLFGDSNEIH